MNSSPGNSLRIRTLRASRPWSYDPVKAGFVVPIEAPVSGLMKMQVLCRRQPT